MSDNKVLIKSLETALETLIKDGASRDKIEAIQEQIAEMNIALNGDTDESAHDLSPQTKSSVLDLVPQAPDISHLASSPVVSKLQSRPVEELIGMAKNRRKELEPDNTGSFLEALIADMQKAQEAKHEFVTAYADVLSQKTDIDGELRKATRNLYGAIAGAIESGDIKLSERAKNDKGEELESWIMPSWLPKGIGVQNEIELVYDRQELEAYARMMQVWDIVSIDEDKLERWLKKNIKDASGKQTAKYAMPIDPPVAIEAKFKPVVGKDADWTPES